MKRHQKCEQPFILDNGCTWRIIEYSFDHTGDEWIFQAEVICDVCSEFRALQVTAPGALNEATAIHEARGAVWHFLNENRQRLGRSLYLWRNYVSVKVLA